MEAPPLPFTAKDWTKTMKYNGEPVLTFLIRRPVFADSGKTRRVERYFGEITNQWKKRWETHLFSKACQAKIIASEAGEAFQPWQAKLTFTVTLWQPSLLSLRIDVSENTETSRPFLVCSGETWDCATGYPRTLRSFFPAKNRRWRKELVNALIEQAEEKLASGESLLDPECAQLIERTFDPEQFYLTEKGLAIYYPLYALGPYAEGIPVFLISLPEP